jgi:tetratricopeptide (TPR) repeat protein
MAVETCLLARRWRRFGVVAAICLFASQGRAGGLSDGGARGADRDAKQEAKARFVSGQSHYNLNEFSQALGDFKEAYRLLPDPVFLYNLGQCERQLGHLEEAIRFYRSFLREQPKAPNRQDVVHKIDEMEATLKSKQAEADKNVAPLAADVEAAPAPVEAEQDAKPEVKLEVKVVVPLANPLPATAVVTPPVKTEFAESGRENGRIDLTTAPATPTAVESPAFYSHWWFWTATGVVLAGAGVGIYAATAGQSPSVPGSTLGSKRVF